MMPGLPLLSQENTASHAKIKEHEDMIANIVNDSGNNITHTALHMQILAYGIILNVGGSEGATNDFQARTLPEAVKLIAKILGVDQRKMVRLISLIDRLCNESLCFSVINIQVCCRSKRMTTTGRTSMKTSILTMTTRLWKSWRET